MRKLVMLVCSAVVLSSLLSPATRAGMIPTWESQSGKVGFYPISNEFSVYKNVDDAGTDRGWTAQFVLINSFKLYTNFNIEFTADYNWDYSYGLNHDHYIEIGLVKPVSSFVSLNYQRVISTFEDNSVNQFGVRLVF